MKNERQPGIVMKNGVKQSCHQSDAFDTDEERSDSEIEREGENIDAKVYIPNVKMFAKKSPELRAMDKYLRRLMDFAVVVCGCCKMLFKKKKCPLRKIGAFQSTVAKKIFPRLTFDEAINELEFLCLTCWKKLKDGKMPAGCFMNNLTLDDVECEELKDVNCLELAMLAIYRICLRIITLPSGGQKASRGYCIQLPSDVQELFRKLPVSLENAGQIFVKNGRFPKNIFKVNGVKILKSLQYLILNHSAYKNIRIDMDNLWNQNIRPEHGTTYLWVI